MGAPYIYDISRLRVKSRKPGGRIVEQKAREKTNRRLAEGAADGDDDEDDTMTPKPAS